MYIQEQELLVQYGVKGRSGRRRGSGTRKKSNKKVDKTRLSKRELLAAEAAKRQREIAKIKKMDSKELEKYLNIVKIRYAKKRFFTAIDFRDKKLMKEQYDLLKNDYDTFKLYLNEKYKK